MQEVDVGISIERREKNRLFAVAPLDNMVRIIRDYYP